MPIAANEYKSVVGLRDLYYALVTEDDANAYTAGTPKVLAPGMTAALAPSVNSATQYADDGPFDVMTAEGETKISLEVTSLPMITLAEITGAVYDATNHRMFDNGGTPPFVAVGFRSKKSSGGYKYFWFLKGRFSKPGEEAASDSDTPDPKPLKLEFTAIKTVYQYVMGATTDGVKRTVGDTDDAGFSFTNWFTAVQVPVYGAVPALTLTASPANNATSVAVGVAPTLTFSNQLATGTNGVILVKQSDASLPAVTVTINTALKIITITPTSSLTALAVYYITISDVTDIYGQKYADTVIKFTCA
jgi:phi13 family phage major tail protein